MKITHAAHILFVILLSSPVEEADAQSRDPYKWPFAVNSIWNMPVGSNAVFVAAEIKPVSSWGMTVDEDIIIMTPDAPLVAIYKNDSKQDGSDLWHPDFDRCARSNESIGYFHIPDGFVVSPPPKGDDPNVYSPEHWTGVTPNHSAAILREDGRTIFQTQPFSRCLAGGDATSYFTMIQQSKSDVDICGDGIKGFHGGSGLSSIGGTIRVGELAPGKIIQHALKINLHAAKNLYYDSTNKGYRWPAIKDDNNSENNPYGGTVKQLRMGALLALKPDFDVQALQTEPAKIIAEAFKVYGGYVVDDTGWSTYAMAIEWGPTGRVREDFLHTPWIVNGESNQFFDFNMRDVNHPWSQDMRAIFANLHVVDDNGPSNIGGSGKHGPMAPPLAYPCDMPIDYEPIKCLLDWAEARYPDLLSPPGQALRFWSSYAYRYYANTNSYAGVSSVDQHVYYLGPNGILQDVGELSSWLRMAACPQTN